jgi:hypothetical protein
VLCLLLTNFPVCSYDGFAPSDLDYSLCFTVLDNLSHLRELA